jgi:hypothetical protein
VKLQSAFVRAIRGQIDFVVALSAAR